MREITRHHVGPIGSLRGLLLSHNLARDRAGNPWENPTSGPRFIAHASGQDAITTRDGEMTRSAESQQTRLDSLTGSERRPRSAANARELATRNAADGE